MFHLKSNAWCKIEPRRPAIQSSSIQPVRCIRNKLRRMDRDNHDCKTLRPELRSHRYLIDVFEGFDCPDQSPSDCNNPHWQNIHQSNYDPNTRADWQRNNLQFLCTSWCIVDQYLGLDRTSHQHTQTTSLLGVHWYAAVGGWSTVGLCMAERALTL